MVAKIDEVPSLLDQLSIKKPAKKIKPLALIKPTPSA
jgi:hypothetical protein